MDHMCVCELASKWGFHFEKMNNVKKVHLRNSTLHTSHFLVLLFQVGLPGKSSVAGSMMMVLPNSMGICIYSPVLDQYGNSIKGLAFCEELVRVFNFHRYDNQVGAAYVQGDKGTRGHRSF